MTAIFTIIAKNYLPFARTLMHSVREYHPDCQRFVLLVDDTESFFDLDDEDFTIDPLTVLDLPGHEVFRFKYSVLELATSVKPFYMRHLLATYDFDTLVYLDPDIMLFDTLAPVLHALEHAAIVLTPHLTAPLDDNHRPDDGEIMRAGTYNLGFIGVRRCAETDAMLRWWEAKLTNHCIVDVERNLFVDQRWMDLVPGMFAGVEILRDPGLNVAYWNLRHRAISRENDRYLVNGVPLRFFHFSGFRADNVATLSRYQDRFTDGNFGGADAIVAEYCTLLLTNGYEECTFWPYTYGTFADGSAIPDACRRIVQADRDLQAEIAVTVDDRDYTAVAAYVLDVVNQPYRREPTPPSVIISRFAHMIYSMRPDVQRAFPDLANTHRMAFAAWFVSRAARDYHLGLCLVQPVAASLAAVMQHEGGVDALHDELAALRAAHAELTAVDGELVRQQRTYEAWRQARETGA